MTVRFGVFAPQGWKTELRDVEGGDAGRWARTVEIAQAAEAAGYDSLWVYDHVHPIPDAASGDPVFECYTTLSALAALTSRIRLGQMVTCNGYRSPALLAHMGATLDVISGGRLEFGIGAGWYAHEFTGMGMGFPGPGERLGMLREAVQVIDSLWRDARTDFAGEHYVIEDGRCDPKPLQSPRPPMWIGGSGEKVTLRIAAELADCTNFGGKPHEWAHKCDVLRRHCDSVGRDYDEITKTIHPDVVVAEDEAALGRLVEARMSKWGPVTGESAESWRAGHLVGTVDEVIDKVVTYVDLGCRHFVMWCPSYPSVDVLDCFAERVAPAVRSLA